MGEFHPLTLPAKLSQRGWTSPIVRFYRKNSTQSYPLHENPRLLLVIAGVVHAVGCFFGNTQKYLFSSALIAGTGVALVMKAKKK